MELNIGSVIASARREKGLTQEALAGTVGVSSAAVSKWETGASYPDITLLPPLARALGLTVDKLLDYREQPTKEEIQAMVKRLSAVFENEGFDAGQRACESVLCDYPTCPALKIEIATLYYRYVLLDLQNRPDDADAEASFNRMLDRSLALFEQSEQETTLPDEAKAARVLRVSVLTMQGKLDEAEAILDAVPQYQQIDTESFYPSLYLAKGDLDKADEYCRRMLKQHVFQTGLTLMNLATVGRRKGDREMARRMADAFQTLYALFGLNETNALHLQTAVALDEGDIAHALDLFDRYVDALQTLTDDDSGNPFFLQAAPSRPLSQSEWKAMNQMIVRNIETDDTYTPLRGEPRFAAALDRLRRALENEN